MDITVVYGGALAAVIITVFLVCVVLWMLIDRIDTMQKRQADMFETLQRLFEQKTIERRQVGGNDSSRSTDG